MLFAYDIVMFGESKEELMGSWRPGDKSEKHMTFT